MTENVDEGVQALTLLGDGFGLRLSGAGIREDVANGVVDVVVVAVEDVDAPDAGLGQLERQRGAERAGADDDDVRGLEAGELGKPTSALCGRQRLRLVRQAPQRRLVAPLLYDLEEDPVASLLLAGRTLLEEGQSDEFARLGKRLGPLQATRQFGEDPRVGGIYVGEQLRREVLRARSSQRETQRP